MHICIGVRRQGHDSLNRQIYCYVWIFCAIARQRQGIGHLIGSLMGDLYKMETPSYGLNIVWKIMSDHVAAILRVAANTKIFVHGGAISLSLAHSFFKRPFVLQSLVLRRLCLALQACTFLLPMFWAQDNGFSSLLRSSYIEPYCNLNSVCHATQKKNTRNYEYWT